MKVKCVKLTVDNLNKTVINGQMKGYIELNKIYIVMVLVTIIILPMC